MAVQAETFSPSEIDVSGIPSSMVAGLCRQSDGAYMALIKVDAELVLPDGRMVRFNRHISVRYTELVGRRVSAIRKDAHEKVG